MKKQVLTLLGLCIGMTLTAQTDVTSTYIANASFEQPAASTLSTDATRGAYTVGTGLTGWTVTGTYGVSDIMTAAATATDNNLGAPGSASDGTQMYYIRNAWSNSSASVKQTVTLPAAKYRLTVDSKSAHAGTSSSGKLVAGGENTTVTLASGSIPSKWTPVSVEFTLTEPSNVTLGFEFTWISSPGASFLLDNVRLYDITDETVEPDPTESDVDSPTEGIIDATFVPESEMMTDLLRMLAKFGTYLQNDFYDCAAPNSQNEDCGYFNGESSGQNNEAGVRTNADLSMICAFLVKYAKPAGIELPTGVTWTRIEEMAMKSLVFAYSTHKANRLKGCAPNGNTYWGSTSTSDTQWESSLWAMSVAYSAYFQWDKLTTAQKGYIQTMLTAECNYELGRSIPTGYAGDTKAEENGWEADVLAATLGLFPDNTLAPQWFERMRLFAANSYSHGNDASNTDAVDPTYNTTTWSDLYRGNNLYSDWTLQNHNLFHTSYQNVVMQELGEAALALRMFQGDTQTWSSAALQHGNQEVMDNVLVWLALADGELAMPNGNDWSLFLYDQITSYSTQACFQRDTNALLLENLAYKQIKARQNTTSDGSWLLRPDVGARRMGVEAHRVMMTYLMHLTMSTADMVAPTWDEFRANYSKAMIFPCQNVVRGYTKDRFTCFSWSTGLKSYTGYFAADKADKNKIVVPYRANNSGNITGWYEVSGKGTNATPVVSGTYQLDGDAWVMNGELSVNDAALNNRFALYSTPGNAFIYLDYVTANSACTITAEKGGLLAISTDELTKLQRTLYYADGDDIAWKQRDGSQQMTFTSDWVNIDNELGVVGHNGKKMAFADRGANNSIYTSKLYPMYANDSRSVAANDVIDARHLVYYSNVTAETTKQMADNVESIRPLLPTGWNGVVAADPDGVCYVFVANFKGSNVAGINDLSINGKAPILKAETEIADSKSAVSITLEQNSSYATPVRLFVTGSGVKALAENENVAYITATDNTTITVWGVSSDGTQHSEEVSLTDGETVKVILDDESLSVEASVWPTGDITKETDMTGYIVNPRFQGNSKNGWTITKADYNEDTNYTEQEFWNNSSFSCKQTIANLPAGHYRLSVQGYYRAGGYASAASSRAAGTESLNARLYATPGSRTKQSVAMESIFEDAGTMGTLGVSTSQGYVPNNMEQASQYFFSSHYDNNSVEFDVEEGESVEIGVEKSSKINDDWTIFTNFRLTLLYNATATLSVSGIAGIGSFVAPFAITMPESVSAWTVEQQDGEEVNMVKITDEGETLSANTAVIIRSGETVTETFHGFKTGEENENSGDFLVGTYTRTEVPQGENNYVLQKQSTDEQAAFYPVNTSGIYSGSNRCYLHLDTDDSHARIAINFDGQTGISLLQNNETYSIRNGKYLKNGHVIIVNDNRMYNTNGTNITQE